MNSSPNIKSPSTYSVLAKSMAFLFLLPTLLRQSKPELQWLLPGTGMGLGDTADFVEWILVVVNTFDIAEILSKVFLYGLTYLLLRAIQAAFYLVLAIQQIHGQTLELKHRTLHWLIDGLFILFWLQVLAFVLELGITQ